METERHDERQLVGRHRMGGGEGVRVAARGETSERASEGLMGAVRTVAKWASGACGACGEPLLRTWAYCPACGAGIVWGARKVPVKRSAR